MNDFARAHNKYLESPEEPEAEFCEDCGDEMKQIDSFDGMRDMKCTNPYCPSKHEGVSKEMAELLMGAREEVKSLARRMNNIKNGKDNVYGMRRD